MLVIRIPFQKEQKKKPSSVLHKKGETQLIKKELNNKRQVKGDTLSVNDAQSILNEMLGESDD